MSDFAPPRAPFVASRAAVASPHQLASAAGLEILARGGNAVDAMVATSAALGVVYPHMSGPGGDAFWLIYDGRTGGAHALNASGRAAAGATRERYTRGGRRSIEPRGPLAALTVPGAVDGWWQAHARFGSRPFAECLAPAIRYARDGYPVSRGQARYTAQCRDLLAALPATAAAFLRLDGSPYRAGERMVRPQLAETLQAVAEGGRAAFYEGPIARVVGATLARLGGVLTADDFARHTSEWEEPIAIPYRAHTALNLPPNSQGFAALQILGVLERFDVRGLRDDPAAYIDLLVRATMLAFEDRDRYLADPAFEQTPLGRLLSPDYLSERAEQVRAGCPVHVDFPPVSIPGRRGASQGRGEDTTFSCCVDEWGNAVGVIQSIYFEWGSGVVAGDTGVLLQNRGAAFSLDPSHPNRLGAGKRTAHTLTAAMLLDPTGRPALVYGNMGGEGQPQFQTAVATRILDFGLDVQAAVESPRWLYGRTWGEPFRGLRLEARLGEAVADRLRQRGHDRVSLVQPWDDLMGHAQAIQVLPDRLEAAADPRSDGAAMGL